jgi:predicted nucleic acid-binding protein
MELVNRAVVSVPFRLTEHATPVSRLLAKYASLPISLADACLVRMAEMYSSSAVLTLDSDFRVYRKHGRQVVPVIMPD